MLTCRFCLQEVVDDNYTDLKNDSVLNSKIAFCIPFVDLNLIPSSTMCLSCVNQLNSFYTFTNMCQRNEYYLRSWVDEVHCIDALNMVNPVDSTDDSMDDKDIEQPLFITDTDCYIQEPPETTTTSPTTMHEENSYSETVLLFPVGHFCLIPQLPNNNCNVTSIDEAKEALTIYEPSREVDLSKVPSQVPTHNEDFCSLLDSDSKEVLIPLEHTVKETERKYDNDQVERSIQENRLHQSSVAGGNKQPQHVNIDKEKVNIDVTEKRLPCQYRRNHASTKSTLRQHVKLHTGQQLFKCCYCDYGAKARQQLKQHLLKNHLAQITGRRD